VSLQTNTSYIDINTVRRLAQSLLPDNMFHLKLFGAVPELYPTA